VPYFIEPNNPGCAVGEFATVKEDGEVMGCHATKQEAIDQGVAIASAENSTFEGERSIRELPENYRPATSEDVPEGRACGNCIFFNEDRLDDEGRAWCERWDAFVEGGGYCNAWAPDEDDEEIRQIDLTPPAYMRASARRGLEWHREGLSGDGIVDRTIREAAAMARGNISADKWVRLRAWIARHLVDMDAPANTPGNDDYPGPGAVAMALWGGGGSKGSARRALAYANDLVGRLEEENEGRAKGEALSKLETRTFEIQNLELREESDGMHLEGYAAVFNSRSENLGGFTETIKPGAFRGSIKSRNDIKFLYNHDTGAVLGSTRAGTLSLTEDDRGLRVSAILPPTTLGNDVRVLVKRGDVTAFSFGFSMPARDGDEWNAAGTERILKNVRLFEVSLVSYPAYPETAGTATVRGLDKIAKRADVDPDALADVLLKIENNEDISSNDRQLFMTVLDALSPEPEVQEPNGDLGMLALKKKKLELLMKGI
jgi:HK97 family phage prohead protease